MYLNKKSNNKEKLWKVFSIIELLKWILFQYFNMPLIKGNRMQYNYYETKE